ncbi:MAG: hypothetical protein ACKVQW_14800 [Pyrinomonadaceae bacterium]
MTEDRGCAIEAKRKNSNADTSGLERNIDDLFQQPYDITPDERAIIEASS